MTLLPGVTHGALDTSLLAGLTLQEILSDNQLRIDCSYHWGYYTCCFCNRFKGPNLTAFDPETDELVPLFNPRTQPWHEHFALDDVMIVGLTPIGRATVRLLNMNTEDRLKVRAVLKDRGELEI